MELFYFSIQSKEVQQLWNSLKTEIERSKYKKKNLCKYFLNSNKKFSINY